MSDVRIPDLNRVIIAGRLARDVELRHTSSGKPMAKFCVVNSRRYKPQGADEWQEVSTFVDGTLWGPGAESLAKLGKGRPVIVEAELSQSEWTDKATGEQRKRLELNATRVTPLDWGQGPTAENRPPKDAAPPPTLQEAYQYRDDAVDDIPF